MVSRSKLTAQEEKELSRFRRLAEATFSGVLVYRDGVILEVNAALCAFMGCEERDLVGHRITEFIAPRSHDRLIERIEAGRFDIEEFDVVVKSGDIRTVEVITREIDYAGGPARVTALRDVTERRRDETLREAERRILTGIAESRPLTEVLDHVCRAAEMVLPGAYCSVLLVSTDGRCLRSGAAPHLPDEYNKAIDGAPIGPKVGSCGTAAFRKQPVIVEDIATDPLWEDFKHLALKHDLRACWSVPLIAKSGKVLGTFATYHRRPYRPSAHDLGVMDRLAASAGIAIQRSQLDAELIAARDRAEAASRAKSEFLANMSHELRTPLNAILGFSEMISSQALGPDARERYVEYAKDIHSSGDRLLSLISDVLDVARVEAGKVHIDRQRCDIASVIEEQLRLIRRAYPEVATIGVRLAAGCPDLHVDHRALGQVLMNVIGNAVKFTPADGAIIVSGEWLAPGLRLLVEDTGPGIPADRVQELGKPFHQVEAAYNRSHSGTGLGLYISRSLMRLHGGDLEITSTLGKGTTVILVFPEDCVMRDHPSDAAEPSEDKLAFAGR
ncbi:MAG TPA: ATP-binding protein [Candidatus Binatia bacterium]|nr:ATP-binding protein [Candidatus Binatia bacterium]